MTKRLFCLIGTIIHCIKAYSFYSDRSVLYLLFDYLCLCRKKGYFYIDEYCNFRLDSQSESFRKNFLPHRLAHKYWDRVLNSADYASLARDKFCSHLLLEKADIPTPQLFCYYNPEMGESIGIQANDYASVRALLYNKNVKAFVCKPSFYSSHGEGVFVCKELLFEDSDCIMVLRDKKLSLRKFLESAGPCLFEALVIQTKQFNTFNPTSVNTVRMVTALYPDNSVKTVAAFVKIGRMGSEVDNAGAGGNADAAIDINNGKIFNSIQFNSWMDIKSIYVHPDTNAQIDGVMIDNWTEMLGIVESYQRRIPFIKMIGWDVAVTDNGPVIIEINNYWDPTGQLFIKRGWLPDVLDCYNAWKDRINMVKV